MTSGPLTRIPQNGRTALEAAAESRPAVVPKRRRTGHNGPIAPPASTGRGAPPSPEVPSVPLPRVVAFSASINRPSRTRTLVEAIAAELGRHRRIDLTVIDLIDAGPGLGALTRDDLSESAEALVAAIEGADALIVGTPVYKGAYSGLFKHVFDFVGAEALVGLPVALAATGGGLRHALVVEHSLRPLFGFFSAHIAPTSVYAGGDEIADGVVADATVAARIEAAGRELDALLAVSRGADRANAPAA